MAEGQAGRLFLGGFNQVLQAQQLAETKRLNEAKLKTAKRMADLKGIETLADFLGEDNPAMRTFLVETLFRTGGVDLKDATAAGLMKVIKTADAQTRDVIADALRQAGIEGMTVEALIPAFRKDPAKFLKFVQQQGSLRRLDLLGQPSGQAPAAPGVARPGVPGAPAAPAAPGAAAAQVGAAPAPAAVAGPAVTPQPTTEAVFDRKAALAAAAGLPAGVSTTFRSQAEREFKVSNRKFKADLRIAQGQADIKERAKTKTAVRKAQFQVSKVIAGATDIIDAVRGQPTIIGAAGAVARGADTLYEQSIAFSNLIGFDIDPALRNPSRYTRIFQEIGTDAVQSAVVQSAIVDIAIAAAAANEQTGRALSDKDIVLHIRRIGAGTGSTKQFVGVMAKFVQDVHRDFQLRANIGGVDVTKSLIIGSRPIEKMTVEDIRALRARVAPELLTKLERQRIQARIRKLTSGQ